MLSNCLALDLFVSEFSVRAAPTLDRVNLSMIDLHRSLVGYLTQCDHHSVGL